MEAPLAILQCKRPIQHDFQHSLLCRAAAGLMAQDGHFGFVASVQQQPCKETHVISQLE